MSKSWLKHIQNGIFSLVINISIPNKIRINNKKTQGYFIRRLAIDYGISVITNIKCAKLYIDSITKVYNNTTLIKDADVKTTYNYVKLPLCIDMHVHVREPGGEHKETWDTCSKAAIKGGIGLICAMPNTKPSCTDEKIYNLVESLASKKSVCDYMIYMGADGKNYTEMESMKSKVCAIKFYLNETYTDLKINNISILRKYFQHCPDDMLMCFHSELDQLGTVLYLASIYKKRVHICHLSRKEEIELVKDAKENGLNVTCEVAPHHLFLTDDMLNNLEKNLQTVKPNMNNDEDKKALWDNIDMIDCFATDHAPHLLSEKHECGCPGFTGLETALPLLINAVNEGKLTIKDIVDKYYTNPKKILGLNEDYGKDSFIEVNMDKIYTIRNEDLVTKAGWTPFNNVTVKGCVERVVFKNSCVYNNGSFENKQGINVNTQRYTDFKNETDINNDIILEG